MHAENRHTCGIFFFLMLLVFAVGGVVQSGCESTRGHNTVRVPQGHEMLFHDDVIRLIDSSKNNSRAQGGIMLVGSSIFRLWTSAVHDFGEWPTVNHAFGGARTWELLENVQELVINFNPKIVICYCGSNDINADEGAEDIAGRMQSFMVNVESALPNVNIMYVSINRAPQKYSRWSVVDEANERVEWLCNERSNRYFIDVNKGLCNEDGTPRMELYQSDNLHFKPQAYTNVFTPMVMNAIREIMSSRSVRF